MLENDDKEQRDFLCPECGLGFKSYVDRIMPAEEKSPPKAADPCPNCGCRECHLK